jgi:hypothetical protein
MTVENISRLKFEAMIFIREAFEIVQFEEVEWFEAYDKFVAIIARDRDDNDYNFNILPAMSGAYFVFTILDPNFLKHMVGQDPR